MILYSFTVLADSFARGDLRNKLEIAGYLCPERQATDTQPTQRVIAVGRHQMVNLVD